MSSPESVSSRIATSGLSSASWSTSLRLRSPPENPSFSGRDAERLVDPETLHPLEHLHPDLEHREVDSLAGRHRLAEELEYRHACDRLWMLEGQEHARLRPRVRRPRGDVLTLEPDRPARDREAGSPRRVFASVDFPEPFGPMRAWIWPGPTCEVDARRIRCRRSAT